MQIERKEKPPKASCIYIATTFAPVLPSLNNGQHDARVALHPRMFVMAQPPRLVLVPQETTKLWLVWMHMSAAMPLDFLAARRDGTGGV